MLKKSLSFFLLLAALNLISACGPRSDDTTPDMAERLLKLRGYFLTTEDFFKAIRLGDGRAVKAFLQAGMDPNVKNKNGQTPLTFALEVTDAAMIEPLMNNADLGLVDDLGNTPVFLALRYNHREVFEQILESGVDINSSGKDGVVEKETILYLAVQKRDVPLVRRLLEKGADPNLADNRGSVPLFDTVSREPSSVDLMNLLIEKGADVNYTGTVKAVTALMLATANYSMGPTAKVEIMKTLLDKGADPNKQDASNGATALIYTAVDYMTPPRMRNEILTMLIEKGANKGLKTTEGKTAYDLAKDRTDDAELIALLK